MKEIRLSQTTINASKRKINAYIKASYLAMVSASKKQARDRYLLEFRSLVKGSLTALIYIRTDMDSSVSYIEENITSEDNLTQYKEVMDDLLFREDKLSETFKRLRDTINKCIEENTTLKEDFYDINRLKPLIEELVYLQGVTDYIKQGISDKGLNFLPILL